MKRQKLTQQLREEDSCLFQVAEHPLLARVASRLGGDAAEALVVLTPLRKARMGFLWHHRVRARAIMPGTAMCEMAAVAGQVSQLCVESSH